MPWGLAGEGSLRDGGAEALDAEGSPGENVPAGLMPVAYTYAGLGVDGDIVGGAGDAGLAAYADRHELGNEPRERIFEASVSWNQVYAWVGGTMGGLHVCMSKWSKHCM